jgi:hypothetical protein
MIVKGTTDKSILWKGADAGVTYNTWVSSENFDLASGKLLSLNAIKIADPNTSTIGPNAGTATGQIDVAGGSTGYTLGSATTGAGATSFNFTGTGEVKLPAGADANRNSSPLVGMLRYNTESNKFEGYSGASPNQSWSALGGSAVVSSGPPTGQSEGDLWYDTDDGRLFIYYNDGSSAQWVDTNPYGLPTNLVIEGNITPETDNSSDLGSATKRWANIYSADLQLSNEGAANDVDGTWGNYTIQEGEDDLFLINRRSGKKYKFMLQEVN